MWIVGQAWGLFPSYGTLFTDLNSANLPPTPQSLPHLQRISVWSNNDATIRLVQGYEMQFTSGTFKNPSTIYNGSVVQSLQLAIGEYITQIQMSCGSYYGISSLQILSSKGQSLYAGGSAVGQSTFTYKAPVGWRIVGFHGKANHAYYTHFPMPTLGAICAPLV